MRRLSVGVAVGSTLLLGAIVARAAIELPVIAWDPGVVGGIPEITGPVESVVDHGAVGDGITSDLAAFEAALAALPDGGVLLVPAGDYFLDGSLEIGTDGVVLRGEGADRSRLLLGEATTASISVVTYGRGDWQPLEVAAARGDTTLIVPDGSAFTVGEWAEIQKADDPDLMYTDPEWNVDWAWDARGQLLEVTAVDGNQVTFRHPLYLDYPLEDTPRIRSQRFVHHVGIEKLYLERIADDSDVGTVLWKNAAYVWMREVESNQTRKAHLATESVIGCQIENNYFHHSYDYGGGGHGYGTSLGFHTTDCLVENNVFRSLRHAMIIQSGASGNVFGYNYSDEVVQSEGAVLNEGWLPPDISVHGHWSNNNLFESNTVEQIGIADYWGPTGPHVAYLRNRVVNDEVRSDGRSESEAIALDDHSNYQYLLGNVVENGKLEDDGTCDMSTNVIHGHVEDGVAQWQSGVDDHEIPVSYYWGCRPAFLGDRAWPLVGPDVTPTATLPATDRFAASAFIASSYERECNDGSQNPGAGGGLGWGGTSAASGASPGSGGNPAGTNATGSSQGDDSGCGCRSPARRPKRVGWTAGLLLAATIVRRRRGLRQLRRRRGRVALAPTAGTSGGWFVVAVAAFVASLGACGQSRPAQAPMDPPAPGSASTRAARPVPIPPPTHTPPIPPPPDVADLLSWSRELDIDAAMLAVGKKRVAVLEDGASGGRYRAVHMRDLDPGAAWRELVLPDRLQPNGAAQDRLELFFGRDDRPRVMGTRTEDRAASPRYYRYRDGWHDRTGEIARLEGGQGTLFGVLGHDDPEVVCKLGEICIIKRTTGWTNVPVPAAEHRVQIAGGSAFAVAPGSALRIDVGDHAWHPIGESAPFDDPCTLWPFADGTLWVAEPTRLHHWNGNEWTTVVSPVPDAEALWGRAPDDVWLVAKGGVGFYDGAVWKQVVGPPALLAHVVGVGDQIWVAGNTGVWIGTRQ